MARLIIAEKPSVARDIAQVLGIKGKGRGAIEGKGWIVTWCIGHLVELVEPVAYNPAWKRWDLASLPMIPDPFQLRPVERTADHYALVRSLLLRKDVEEVINACDAGREGELIFRYVYVLSGCKAPVKRLWISSMTDEAIRQGFDSLRPGDAYQRLWFAARCRSEADWLVGLNGTRAITVKVRESLQGMRELFSVGRVQTPTLAMVVAREKEILAFTPEDYFQLRVDLKAEAGAWKAMWFKGKVDRFETEAEAQAVLDKVEGKAGIVTRVDKKKGRERPPFLFDLTRLQRTANKRYGFSAAHTLAVAQALYEKHKLLTYPRTDSSHLSKDMIPEVPKVFRALMTEPYAPFAETLIAQVEAGKQPTPKRVFDDAKVSDHHGIIPTPRRPNLDRLNQDEARLYDLVARRFLAAFFPDALFERTQVITTVLGETFQVKGKVYTDPGWRTVMGFEDDETKAKKKKRGDDEDDDDASDEESLGLLPPLKKGDGADVTATELLKKQTRPPSRYTEATLLAAMEGAGRLLDDDELQAAMKDSGLGTPATRASIIETLFSRSYMARKGKSLYPLEKGIQLIDVVPDEGLGSPHLTGEWEARLARMARGEGDTPEAFMADVAAYVRGLITQIKATPIKALAEAVAPVPRGPLDPADAEAEGSLGPCPQCGGAVMEKGKVFVCEGPKASGQGCGFRIFRTVAKKTLSPNMAKDLLLKGQTKLLKGFTAKSGRSFDAALKLEAGGRVTFDFPERGPAQGAARSGGERGSRAGGDRGSRAGGDRGSRAGGDRGSRAGGDRGSRAGGDARRSEREDPAPDPWTCPQCGEGTLLKGRSAYGCARWREGCTFRLPFEVEGQPLHTDALLSLLREGAVTLGEGVRLRLVKGDGGTHLEREDDPDAGEGAPEGGL